METIKIYSIDMIQLFFELFHIFMSIEFVLERYLWIKACKKSEENKNTPLSAKNCPYMFDTEDLPILHF